MIAAADELRVLADREDPGRERAPAHARKAPRCAFEPRNAATAPCWRSRTRAAGSRPSSGEQLFERFYRLDGARASGSGLGLAIAQQLAELMDGAPDGRIAPRSHRRSRSSCRRPRSDRPTFSRENGLSARSRSYSASAVRRRLRSPLLQSSAPSWAARPRSTAGKLAGWVGPRSTTTVFRSSPVLPDGASAVTASVGPNAKPLAGQRLRPAPHLRAPLRRVS